jgi:hypothetical protein
VFRHRHISEDQQLIFLPHAFQRGFKGRSGGWGGEAWTAVKTTGREKVKLEGFLEALESPRHGRSLVSARTWSL